MTKTSTWARSRPTPPALESHATPRDARLVPPRARPGRHRRARGRARRRRHRARPPARPNRPRRRHRGHPRPPARRFVWIVRPRGWPRHRASTSDGFRAGLAWHFSLWARFFVRKKCEHRRRRFAGATLARSRPPSGHRSPWARTRRRTWAPPRYETRSAHARAVASVTGPRARADVLCRNRRPFCYFAPEFAHRLTARPLSPSSAGHRGLRHPAGEDHAHPGRVEMASAAEELR